MNAPATSLSRTQVWLILALAVAFALLVGLGAYALHQRQVAQAWQTQADTAKDRADALTQQAKAADLRVKVDRAETTALYQEVDRLEVALKAVPKPPKALPPPAADPDLGWGLETAGMHPGLAIAPRGSAPSTLEREDAELAWSWHQETLRVPLLEQRLDVAEHLVESQDVAAQALKKENLDTAAARDLWRSANGAQLDRAEALQNEVKALHRAGTAVEVGAAVVVTALIVRSLARGK